jgi:cell division protein FtsQ
MGLYQGRALESGRRPTIRPRRAARMPWPVRWAFGVAGLVVVALVAAHLPWRWLREHVAVVHEIRVEGARYLDAARIGEVAGLHAGDDLFALDLVRARQALLLDPRIARARVARAWPRDVRVRIVEREPVLLVRHGVPWEVDSAGVLLPPLARGVVADVPLLTGPDFARWRAGTQVLTPEMRRGLAWVRALAAHELQLAGDVSEVDVGDPRATDILLMNGTRVLGPAWPPGARVLSALRVVLADLKQRGVQAREVDLRFENQVVVKPADAIREPAQGAGLGGLHHSG